MDLKTKLNQYGKTKTPFFFLISYDLLSWDVIPLKDLPNDIFYNINQIQNKKHNITLQTKFIDFSQYQYKFNQIIQQIKNGNTYLLNLTTPTQILNNINLKNIYQNSNAKYKLYYKNQFVSFSPETFITIQNNTINTFPMKGTIDATIPNAKNIILNDPKELAEHIMIVDLLRNDLNIVSSNVKVKNFRYIQKIQAGEKELYQISSHICGNLQPNWQNTIGDIITNLLPAGSITGTPKRKTVEIIQQIEQYNRGYFTGIWGIFDGTSLNSSVLIRYIEKQNNNLIYKSGGGITLESDCTKEYQEMKDKVYVP